jgi:hypothetical protein
VTPARRALALALAASLGCAQWRPVSLAAVRAGEVELRSQRARFAAPDGSRDLLVTSIIGPFAQGRDVETGRGVRVDLDRVRAVEVRRPDHLLNALIVGAIYVSVFTLGGLSFADGLPPVFGQR